MVYDTLCIQIAVCSLRLLCPLLYPYTYTHSTYENRDNLPICNTRNYSSLLFTVLNFRLPHHIFCAYSTERTVLFGVISSHLFNFAHKICLNVLWNIWAESKNGIFHSFVLLFKHKISLMTFNNEWDLMHLCKRHRFCV